MSWPSRWLTKLIKFVGRPSFVLVLLILSLVGLPFVMVNSLASATAKQMELQADEISTLATGIRSYYADNVVSRLQQAGGKAVFSENYREVHGGIPIPATLSIELGALFDSAHSDGRINYAFLSDYPFARREVPPLDNFEKMALQSLRKDPNQPRIVSLERPLFGTSSYRLATPVFMRPACVTCHNQHPDSPKRDWKVGDVRGIQEVTVRGIQVNGFGQIGYLVGYVALLGVVSVGAAVTFQRQNKMLLSNNIRLKEGTQREVGLSNKLRQQVQELSLLGSVVENATFGVSIADMRRDDYPLIYVNEAFSKITGYPKDKAAGFNCRFLRGPDTDPNITAEIARAIREGRPFTCELVNYRLNGERFWNRLTIYPFGGKPGKPDFYVGNQVDITNIRTLGQDAIDKLTSFITPLDNTFQHVNEVLALIQGKQFYDKDGKLDQLDLEKFFRAGNSLLAKAQAELEALNLLANDKDLSDSVR
jgi:PAS domain S-box-containing protein